MANDLMIETKEMTKAFGKLIAVDKLSLKVRKGEIHGFVGPNGAGKSTTIKMLVGAIKCTRGEGFIKGHRAGSVESRKIVGYSPERPSFYKDMTAWHYLVYMAALSGLRIGEAESRATELLDWLELNKFADTKVDHFSAGMKQRLSIAQAMAHKPELLILDEPTANLDPGSRMSVLEKLKSLPREQNVTVFVSSHILSELEYLIDTVTFIDKGHAVAENRVELLKQEIALNRYVLHTSNNQAVMKGLQCKPGVQEIWLDADGVIHMKSEDLATLQRVVMEAVTESNAMLKYFGAAQVKLEDIYRSKIMPEKD